MAKKSLVFVVLFVATAILGEPIVASAQAVANCAKGSAMLGILGALIAGNHARGAEIGAGIGCAVGLAHNAAMKDQQRAAAEQRQSLKSLPRIASAFAPTTPVSTVTVLMRDVSGANSRALSDILPILGARLGYGFIDPREQWRLRLKPTYLLDIDVVQQQYSSGSGSASFPHLGGSGSGFSEVYQVSLVMTNYATGIVDPTRSATVLVAVRGGSSGSAFVYIGSVSGGGSHSTYASDPGSAAAEAALVALFGASPSAPTQ